MISPCEVAKYNFEMRFRTDFMRFQSTVATEILSRLFPILSEGFIVSSRNFPFQIMEFCGKWRWRHWWFAFQFNLYIFIDFFFLAIFLSSLLTRDTSLTIKDLWQKIMNFLEIFASCFLLTLFFHDRDYVPRLRTGVRNPSFYLSFIREPISTR